MTKIQNFAIESPRIPERSQSEYDAFQIHWKRLLPWRPGQRKALKRAYNRRWRKLERIWLEVQT